MAVGLQSPEGLLTSWPGRWREALSPAVVVAGGASVAVCGTRVDQVEPDRPFPPTRGPGSPDPCPLCEEGIERSAPRQH